MKNLVTGGAGFLGSHLCEQLLAQGEHVVCIDNLSTGRLKNMQHLLSNRNFKFIEQNILDPIDLRIDRIYNLASPASPVAYQADPIGTLKTNAIGAMNLLDLAVKEGARILQASTSEVYGDPELNPQPESYWGHVNPIGIRSCYDEGKRAAETLFFDYHRVHAVEIKVVRIFNTYGPRMSPTDGRVISNLLVQAIKGLPLTVYGDGRQTRSFCYVDDLVSGIILAMQSPSGFLGPVNLGNPEQFTILELIEMVAVCCGTDVEVCFKELPQDDPKVRCPDISIAQEALGWHPEVTLKEGLDRTRVYFEAIL